MSDDNNNYDIVTNPKHYQLLPGVQVIDVRDALLDRMDDDHYTARQIDCWSRSWEYLTRFASKNGLEDLKKAQWYLERMIADLEKHVRPVADRRDTTPVRRPGDIMDDGLTYRERQDIRDKLALLRRKTDGEHSVDTRS